MFNLKFSKSDDSIKRNHMTITRNDWIINGKVIDVKETEKGFWLKVKTKAKLSELFLSDKLVVDCYLSKKSCINFI